ncbi:MAG: single-stranded DNA-binding protein [Candidimonas sp.]|nr:MAG: single-stranded DNA-binding protein [Candidimonas sp.]TAM24792.1 MAG: single-stranded DNA-binding protein [Candidimonas sp.]
MASLVGLFRICRDSELRHLPSDGRAVTTLLLAYDFGPKGLDGRRPSQFIEADLWDKRAEDLAQFLRKGREIHCVIDDVHSVASIRADGTAGSKLIGRANQIDLGRRPAQDRREYEQEHAA